MNEINRQVLLLEGAPWCADVAKRLQEASFTVNTVVDSSELVEATRKYLGEVIVAPLEQTGAVRDAFQQAESTVPPLPLLVLSEGLTVNQIESLRAKGVDALSWPHGAEFLESRVLALVRRQTDSSEVRLRQSHSQVFLEVATRLDYGFDYEKRLLKALGRLVEHACIKNATVMVKSDDEEVFYIMASTDEPSRARLPVAVDDYPEVAVALAESRELIEPGPHRISAGDTTNEESGDTNSGDMIILPLRWQGRAYGAMVITLLPGDTLHEATIELLRCVSSLIASSLRGSNLYKSLREQTSKKMLVNLEARQQREVLQKYEEFFERAFDGILVIDRQHQVLFINPAGEQITGYSRRGLFGTPLANIVEGKDQSRLLMMLRAVGESGTMHSFDLGLISTSGDTITVEVSPSAVLAEDTLFVLSFRDVTEARSLENELRSTKEFLERLIDSTTYAIVAADITGRLILFNKGAERLFGWAEAEILEQMNLSDLFSEGLAGRLMAHLRSPEDGGVGRLEAVRKDVLNKDGNLIPVAWSANILYEGSREVGTVAIFRDLRDRLVIERRLAQAQEKLLETEKQALIAELAGTTAHELNQPLTSIMGYAELLQRRISQDDSNHRAVDTIIQEAERMAEIVRKIGKITRYETKAYVGSTQILDLEKSSE